MRLKRLDPGACTLVQQIKTEKNFQRKNAQIFGMFSALKEQEEKGSTSAQSIYRSDRRT